MLPNALATGILLAAAVAGPPVLAFGDEPPEAQARAVAALPTARILTLAYPPAKDIPGMGRDASGAGTALQGRVSGIEAAMRDLNAKVVGREIHIELPADVLFDFDRAEIRPDAGTILSRVGEVVRAHPGAQVLVEGHTDSVGEADYNLALSERRAQAVVRWLETHEDLPRSGFSVKGFGETRPTAPNTKPDGADDPAGRQRNRRVELVVTTRGS